MAEVKLKGNLIHTSGELPKVGSVAPDFKLTDSKLTDHSLKDFAGKKKILSIVPSLDTPTCSLSAKKFNEAISKYPNTVVLVISADLPFAQKRVCDQEHYDNILSLSTFHSNDFVKAYGVLILDGPIAGLCARAIVVLDENNKVLYTEQVPEITQEPSYEKALQALS